MPRADLIREAERHMVICNSCRYCEGYCAVFPAMELRRTFASSDLVYLANLCFDCRDCYYACQYAPPHEFAVNVPKVFAELRAETYGDYAWPRILAGLFKRPGLAVGLVVGACIAVVLFLVLTLRGQSALFSTHIGDGSFYQVVPYAAMVLPALAVTLYGLVVLMSGTVRFWRNTNSGLADVIDLRALVRATQDAFGLRYMTGGGAGCNYPGAGFSQVRRWLHHLVFYGFLLDLASTTAAAVYDHLLGRAAPYPLLSLPVLLGTVGGIALLLGSGGLFYLKYRSDKDPAEQRMLGMDVAFLAVLFLTALTGLLLLGLRDTPAMGKLLAVHLGVVAALFITAPYGKFVHLFYRYAALVRNSIEQARN